MSKGSRKAERRLLRQQKAREDFIRNKYKLKNLSNLSSNPNFIPELATLNPKIDDLVEKHILEDNFKIIFARYNFNSCQLCQLSDSKEAKKLIELFNQITQCNPKLLPTSGIVRDNINNCEPYTHLFATVPPDTELKEADFSDKGRLFFYIYRNYFCIISIKVRHL